MKNGAWGNGWWQTWLKGRRGKMGFINVWEIFMQLKVQKHMDINMLLTGEQRRKIYIYFHFTSIACWNCSCSFCSCSASCNELAVIRPAFNMDSPLRIQPNTLNTHRHKKSLVVITLHFLTEWNYCITCTIKTAWKFLIKLQNGLLIWKKDVSCSLNFCLLLFYFLPSALLYSLFMCTNIFPFICLLSNNFLLLSQPWHLLILLHPHFGPALIPWLEISPLAYFSISTYFTLLSPFLQYTISSATTQPASHTHTLREAHKIPFANCFVGLVLPKRYVKYSLYTSLSLTHLLHTCCVGDEQSCNWILAIKVMMQCNSDSCFPATSTEPMFPSYWDRTGMSVTCWISTSHNMSCMSMWLNPNAWTKQRQHQQ